MPRTPKPALRKPKPRSPRPTSRLPISAHGICPFRAPSFFLRNFFSAPCADAGRMLPGAGRWEFGPPGEGAGAPGRDSESLPEDRLRVLRFRGRVRAPRPVPWTVPGVAAVSVVRGPRLIPGPGSGNRAGVRAPRRFPRPGFVVRGRVPWTVPGGMRRKAFSGLGPGRLPKAFRLRRIFPRTEAFSAAHERRRGNPRSAFPSGGGPGSAGSRVPGAGAGCGTFLRRPHPAAENRGNPASPVKKETFQTGFVEEL